MTHSIAEAIRQNTDLDIIKTFNSLPSQATKVQATEQVIDLYRQEQSHLIQHRCLLTLARLSEELMTTSSSAEPATVLHLFQRCLDMGLISKPLHDLTENLLPDLTEHLSSSLRTRATQHLREAIVALCPSPGSDVLAFKGATYPFKEVSMPVRLDLGMGGISDIPPYGLERYGNCINVPIRLNGDFPLKAKAEVLTESVIQFVSKNSVGKKTSCYISKLDDQLTDFCFYQEVLRFFLKRILGLNTTEDLYSLLKGGLCLESSSCLPVGTGLGVSSLLVCVIMKALASLLNIALPTQTLFAASVYLENVMGIGGGWEDSTAIFPGVKLMESFPETPLSPQVKQLALSDLNVQKIQEHLMLVYTGIPKEGPAFFEKMIERYCLRDAGTLQAIKRNNTLNRELSEHLVAGDIAGIGQTMQSQWENWKILSEGKCTNPKIDRLFVNVAPYVHGARMNGSGQGGCAMFIVQEGKKEELARVLRTVQEEPVTFYRWEPIL